MGIRINAERIKEIQELRAPGNIKKLQGVLGCLNFCRRFIPNIAQLAAPLTKLLKKDSSFQWKEEQEEAFKELKKAFMEHCVLAYPNFSEEFESYTDASKEAIGAFLRQGGKMVAAISRKLTKPELDYSVTEKEALAIVWALREMRCYLLGSKFNIYSDHKCLGSLAKTADPTGRIARWLSILADYDLDIKLISGEKNCAADLLSRSSTATVNVVRCEATVNSTTEILKEVKNMLENGQVKGNLPRPIVKKVMRKAKKYYLENGVLKKRNWFRPDSIVVLDSQECAKIVKQAHSLGHPGTLALFEDVSRTHYWPSLYEDCKRCVEICQACRESKPPKHITSTNTFDACGIFELFHLDYVGPLNETASGNRYILVAVDRMSKMLVTKDYKNATSENAIEFIKENIIYRFGKPEIIVTDRGSHFCSHIVEQFLGQNSIEHVRTTAYHPAANGQVERFN